MKRIDWKTLAVTSLLCLVPMLIGLVYWNDLPATLATHVSVSGAVNGETPKNLVVFGFPLAILLCQLVLAIGFDVAKVSEYPQARITKWVFPFLAVTVQLLTLGYNLGVVADQRKFIIAIIALTWLVVGNFGTKKSPTVIGKETAWSKNIQRVTSYLFIAFSLLLLVSLFLPFQVSFVLMMAETVGMVAWSIYCAVAGYRKREWNKNR